MKPLTLKLKQKITYRIDMSFLSDAYKYKSIKHFMSKKIIYGNQEFKVSELFSVTGNQLNNIVIKSAIPLMDNIGYKQQSIRMNVYGNIGYSFGKQMVSGSLVLHGNALDYAASGMKGGKIFIYGNAGDHFGAKPNAGNEGILDGFIYVKGNVGNDSFQRVRRGNIIIDGNIGNDACREMISGSILIKGSIGNSFGIDIKRGSIFIKDRKLTRDYTQSNDAEYNFIKFYLTQLKSIIKKKIFLEKKKLKRYYGNKDKNNLSEIFLFTA